MRAPLGCVVVVVLALLGGSYVQSQQHAEAPEKPTPTPLAHTATPTRTPLPTSTPSRTPSPTQTPTTTPTTTITPTLTPTLTPTTSGPTVPDCHGVLVAAKWDVNQDGAFNNRDATWIAQYVRLVGAKNAESYDAHFDVSGDGRIDSVDATQVANMVSQANCIPTPPPSPTATPTATSTPTPQIYIFPTQTPLAATCPLYSLQSVIVGPTGFLNRFLPTSNGASLTCLTSLMANATGFCSQRYGATSTATDDCIYETIMGQFAFGYNVGSNPWHEVWFFDSQCRRVCPGTWISVTPLPGSPYPSGLQMQACGQIPGSVQVCDAGRWEWLLSPLSLIWNDEAAFGVATSLVNFPIDPGSKGRTYRWYASADTPLLVWDPTHSGIIRDGTQLFGHWTFGGPRLAALNTGATQPLSVRWKNGYDALASLDSNGDDEVSGSELKDLALWFDTNRDGVSQPGEVRSLAKEGVTKLFYNADSKDSKRGHLFASRGFERINNGKTQLGRSVDWFAEGDINSMFLAQKLISEPSVASENEIIHHLQKALDREKPDSTTYASASSEPVARGVWEWQMKTASDANTSGFEPKGYLAFSSKADGTISGLSVVELPFIEGHPVKSSARAYQLQGVARSNDQFTFELAMPKESTTKLSNTVKKISPTVLEGTTKVLRVENGSTSTLEYSWIAKKVVSK
jgi:hypothetical protein